MDYPPDKPIFANPLVLAESDETESSIWSSQPRPKTIPKAIRSLIGKVGLRYEPSVKADLDAHAARVALLAEDMADVDAGSLARAIDIWVKSRPYMPKASDLHEYIAGLEPQPSQECVDVVTLANDRLAAKGSNLRWHWNNPECREAGTYLVDTTPLENKLASRDY